jgi:transposase-like protein
MARLGRPPIPARAKIGAKADYRAGVPLNTICRTHGLTPGLLAKWVRHEHWPRPQVTAETPLSGIAAEIAMMRLVAVGL